MQIQQRFRKKLSLNGISKYLYIELFWRWALDGGWVLEGGSVGRQRCGNGSKVKAARNPLITADWPDCPDWLIGPIVGAASL